MSSRSIAAWLFAAVASATGCSKDPEYDGCTVERPAFLVRLSARAEALPGDTSLQVTYGAGTEEYLLDQPPERPDVVICTFLSQQVDAGGMIEVDASSPVQELLCELWTQGGADLVLRASGYPTQKHTLRADRDECGIETVEYDFVLERADAGRL